MYDKVISYLNANKLLYEHQYGFRSGHSTIHPIIHLLNHCSEATNKPNPDYTLAIFCDLSKAFNVIDHRILLHKLSAYGIRGLVKKWFASYLTDLANTFILKQIHLHAKLFNVEYHKDKSLDLYCI